MPVFEINVNRRHPVNVEVMPLSPRRPRTMIRTKYTEEDFNTAANGICPGPDLEWFAVDRDFNVAGFTNAGFGVVPQTVFQSFNHFNDVLDAMCLLQLIRLF